MMSHWRGDNVTSGVAYNISAEFTDNNIPIILLVYNNTETITPIISSVMYSV